MISKRKRFRVLCGVFALISLLILSKYAMLAFEGPGGPARNRRDSERGAIVDSEGRELAVQSDLYDLAVWKPEIGSDGNDDGIGLVAEAVGMEPEAVRGRIDSSETDYAYIKRRLTSEEANRVRALRDAGKAGGFLLETARSRTYPQGELLSHLVGFSGADNHGLAGVELSYDAELLPGEDAKPAADGVFYGNRVELTVDSAIQLEVERIAAKAVKENRAESAMFLAMSPKTGEVLAYAVVPSFDPNRYYEYPAESFSDWASQKVYEPGSVFKVFSMASLVQLGGIDETSSFVCDGAYEHDVPGKDPIRIKCLGTHGNVTVSEILEYSCNAGAAYASDTVAALDFYSAIRTFGFGDRTGLGLPGESGGMLRSSDTWSLRSKPTIAMGQEVLVTAIQMAQAATAVANRGVLMKPLVVRRVRNHDGIIVFENRPVAVRRVLSEDNASRILSFMEGATRDSGTGKRARVDDLRMAVKTGTAQMLDKKTGRYSETDFIASCLAIFPVDDPELILYLAINKPMGQSYYGGKIAAPPVGEAADSLATALGIPRGKTRTVAHSGRIDVELRDSGIAGDTMPDLAGKPKSAVFPLFRRADLVIRMSGEGYLVRQSPAPGEPIPPGTEIILEFK